MKGLFTRNTKMLVKILSKKPKTRKSQKTKKIIFRGFLENGWSDFKNILPIQSRSLIRFFLMTYSYKNRFFEFSQKKNPKNGFLRISREPLVRFQKSFLQSLWVFVTLMYFIQNFDLAKKSGF